MNWYNIFYWVTRGDSIKDFFDTSSNIFTTLTVILFIGLVIITILYSASIDSEETKNDEEDKKTPKIRSLIIARKYFSIFFYVMLFLSILTWSGYVLTPTKKDALLILAAGGTMNYLTTDSTAKQLPHEMTNFVVSELKTMAKEAKVDFGIATQKEKILEEAKQMSTQELLDKIQADSNFANVILNK